MSDGTPYIPVVVLCQILGLRSDSCIRRWRKLLLWSSARKLPMETEKWGKRVVWCLPLSAFPLWLCCISWKAILPNRQKQLLSSSNEFAGLPKRIYSEMLTHYRQIRRFLFKLVTVYIDADADLDQFSIEAYGILDNEDHVWLDELVNDGRTIIRDIKALAQRMLQTQREIPIIDAFHTDHYGSIMETFSLPLFPFIPNEDEEQLFEYIEMLKEWYQDITIFLEERSS